MIDFHTHVLPGIDDGARDIIEANGMLELLKEQNITHVICTSHFDPSRMTLQEFVEKRANSISQINRSIIPLIPASETMLHPYLFHYPDISELCIENTKFLLIELPCIKKWDEDIYKTIERLISYYDITPIIAHIERYPEVIRKTKTVRRFIKMGCLIQLNTSSVLDKTSTKKAFQYIKKGYIDLLGSDCHNLDLRPPLFAEALQQITQRLGPTYCEVFESNGNRIIQGLPLRASKETYLILPPGQN